MPAKLKDIIGLRFGRWTILARADRSGEWFCKCDCGEVGLIRGTALRTGLSQSCGCRARELSSARQRARSVGNPARRRGTIEYFKCTTWNNIRKRVINGKPTPNNRSYIAKGIELRVSKEEFYSWCDTQRDLILSMRMPSIDRVDNMGHYELGNIQILEHSDNAKKQHTDGTNCYFTVNNDLSISGEHN